MHAEYVSVSCRFSRLLYGVYEGLLRRCIEAHIRDAPVCGENFKWLQGKELRNHFLSKSTDAYLFFCLLFDQLQALGTGQSSHRAPKKRIKNPESFDNVGNMQSTAVDVGEWQKFLETCAAGKYTGEQVIDAVCTKRNRFAVFTDKRFLYCNVKGRRVKWSVVYARLSDISGGGQPCQVNILFASPR